MPDLAEQLEALERSSALVQLPGRTQLEITGADRAKFLNNFSTGDIKSLSPGTGCEAFVTSVQGKTIGHILVFCQTDSLVVETVPNQAAFLIEHFDKYLFSDDVQFVDQTKQFGEFLFAGPTALSVFNSCFRCEPPSKLMEHVDFDCGSVRRVEMLGPTSLLISCERRALHRMWELQEAGAAPLGQDAYHARRIQCGWPEFGSDINDENLPQEVGRDEQAISFTKGCYLGQETVARIDAMGHVNRKLVGLKFENQSHVDTPVDLSREDKVVGKVTSAAFHPSFNSVIALGYVRQAHAKAGNILASSAGDVEVVDLPLDVKL